MAAFGTSNNNINALLAGNSYRWNAGSDAGTAVTVSYSFLDSLPSYYASNAAQKNGFAALTETMKSGVRQALAQYEQICNVTFVESAGGSTGQITFGQCKMSAGSAYAYYGGGSGISGDVFFNVDYAPNKTPTVGSYGFMTMVHEIGHAMGLKHPGNYDAGGGGTPGPYLPSSTDNTRYSVMSYNGGALNNANPQTLQLYDIQALQYLYGANTSWATGDDVYTFSTSAPTTKTIWDAGGTDTIDASNQTLAATIRLTAGSHSSIGINASGGAASNNFAIAYGALIENAIGGAGADAIYGNALANTLTGGAGNDRIDGGADIDTAVFTGARSEYKLWLENGQIKVMDLIAGRDGVDTLTTVENLQFSDGVVATNTIAANRLATGTGAPISLALGASVALTSLYAATDADGDAITLYRIFNPTGAGTINLNGAVNQYSAAEQAKGNYQFTAADFAKLTYTGAGSETLTFYAYDGVGWSAATNVAVTNRAPTGVGVPTGVALGATVAVSSLYSATDAEGDTVTLYRIVNPVGAGTINLNGAVNMYSATEQAKGNYQFTAADFAKLTYAGAGSETLTFSAYDGKTWSAVTNVAVTNRAPTGVGVPTGVALGATVAVSSLYSATDAEGDTVTLYRIVNPVGAGTINLNGAVNMYSAAEQAKGNYQFTAADFAKLTYTGAGSETLTFSAYDGKTWSAVTNVAVTNRAPTGVANSGRLALGATVAVSSLYSATDPEGDAVTLYRIVNPVGAGTINLNGAVNMYSAAEQAKGNYQFTAADFAKLTYTGAGGETLKISAYDGKTWNVASNVVITNSAPTVTAAPANLTIDQTVAVTTLYSASDAENDAITHYRIVNPVGAGTINLNGAVNQYSAAEQAKGNYQFTAADFAKLTYTGRGNETLKISAYDGKTWGVLTNVAITNAAPTGAAAPANLAIGETVAVTTLYSATDAENDTVTHYRIVNPVGAGTINLNGAVNQYSATEQAKGNYQFTAADFAKLTYTGRGNETLKFSAYDGGTWNTATNVAITNAAPTGAGVNANLDIGETVAVTTLYSATDAESDTVTHYRIVNPVGAGTINLNGAVNQYNATEQAKGNYQFTAADFAKLTYTGRGNETLKFSAYDGGTWNTATNVAITNAAPTGAGASATLSVGETVAVTTLYSATDAENDAVTHYRIVNPVGAGTINLNGAVNQYSAAEQAKGNYQFTAADFAKLTYTGRGNETLKFSAYDGGTWNTATNVAITNAAPAGAAAPAALANGQVVAVTTLYSATDAESDPVTHFRIVNPAGAGTINLNGAVNQYSATDQAKGNYQVSAADFAKITYTANGPETLRFAAFDGGTWNAFTNVAITRGGGGGGGGMAALPSSGAMAPQSAAGMLIGTDLRLAS